MSAPVSELQPLSWPWDSHCPLLIKRDDQIHPEVGGNKWRKLLGVLEIMKSRPGMLLRSMGGPHSNHIAALAAFSRLHGIRSHAVIRDTGERNTPTLVKARREGLETEFVSRATYRQLRVTQYSKAEIREGEFFLPEGGGGVYSEIGLASLAQELVEQVGECQRCLVMVAAGTGSTALGLALHLPSQFDLQIHPAGRKFGLRKMFEATGQFQVSMIDVVDERHLGVYGKVDIDLWDFICEYERTHKIALDPIYTGPMMRRLLQVPQAATENYDAVIFYHSGGLQGRRAYAQKLGLHI